MSQLLLPFCGGFAQRCLLPHAFTEMWQSMKALLLELDENGLKKKKGFLGPVITGRKRVSRSCHNREQLKKANPNVH